MGLGGNEIVEAYESKGNQIRIGNAYKTQQTLYLIYDKQINFSPRLGMPIHGIIGHDFFKDFVVKVNYIRQNLIFYPPDKALKKKCRRCETKDIRLVDKKPFISAFVNLDGETDLETNLLMDTGSSDALWLFESESIQVPDKHFYDYLGKELSGHIYGNRAKLKTFLLNKYLLRNPTVAFPDSMSLVGLDTTLIKRRESVGGEILKRFNWVFDYSENKMYFRKNANFSLPFEYNMSGIEIEHNGFQLVRELNRGNKMPLTGSDSNNTRLNVVYETTYRLELKPSYRIASIRKDSPADLAGLQPGDVLVSINQMPVHRYSLDKLNALLFEKEGKKITIRVLRNHFHYEFQFLLKPMF